MELSLDITFVGLDSNTELRLRRYHGSLADESRSKAAQTSAGGRDQVEHPARLDPSLQGCIAGVGSSWDETCGMPRSSQAVETGEAVAVDLTRLSSEGGRLSLEWPVELPLGELLLLTLSAAAFSSVSVWGRVVGVKALSSTPARRTSSPALPSRPAGRAA